MTITAATPVRSLPMLHRVIHTSCTGAGVTKGVLYADVAVAGVSEIDEAVVEMLGTGHLVAVGSRLIAVDPSTRSAVWPVKS